MLPDQDSFFQLAGELWRTKILSNCGPFHERLEEELRNYLNVPTAMLFNNGTVALLCALKMFRLPAGSEVVTTPLTFAATAHAISWNGLTPVFVDVNPQTLTICPNAVEKAITSKTSAILGVHVYGSVCDLAALSNIAQSHNLKLIYDAAHAFGTTVGGVGIGTFGDASVFSFHATKLFHTLEGGMITTNSQEDAKHIHLLRNFGIKNEEEVVQIGINGKMNELQAIMGLLNLPLVNAEKNARNKLRHKYSEFLKGLPGIGLQPEQAGVSNSEQYFVITVDEERFGKGRDDIYQALKSIGIHARKYFHPICSDFEVYKGSSIVTTLPSPWVKTIKNRVLCLPFHSGVDDQDVEDIRKVFLS
ncbi:MAG: DegT/DnrJ/EryC1/StrS family aminotransferase [Pseudomonadota bacterium]|nr:DegT/DnrJ/EryC1/StrS family aminotransferase [Pseudomonadota bacterium]